MACLRDQTLVGRLGNIHCDEEGCEFRLVSFGRYSEIDEEASKADCLLQLRLRARNIAEFERETDQALSILRRNRYSTVPPYEWIGPDPEPKHGKRL